MYLIDELKMDGIKTIKVFFLLWRCDPTRVMASSFLTLRLLMSYIYDIRSLRVNDLTLILLTWRKW